MTRTVKTITITAPGRDQNKSFIITEMSAEQAEDWFMRAMGAIARGGVDVPPDLFFHGAAGFVTLGIGAALAGLGKAPWPETKALTNELMACVGYVSPSGATVVTPSQVSSQIEEVATRLQLKEEVLSLHLGFSLAERLSTFRQLAATMITALTPTTETSAEPLVQSSALN